MHCTLHRKGPLPSLSLFLSREGEENMRLGPGRRNLQRGTRAWSEATRRGRRRSPRLAPRSFFCLQRRRGEHKAKHGARVAQRSTNAVARSVMLDLPGRCQGRRIKKASGARLAAVRAPLSDHHHQRGARSAALCQPELPPPRR